MSKINTIIEDFSTTNLIAFLRTAIPSFKPDDDELDHLFQEDIFDKYESIVKIGEAKIDKDDLIVIASKTNEPLTERSGKRKQYEIAKTILKHEVKDAAIFVFYDDEGNFRFSFVKANYLGTKRDFTDFKRYTYFVSRKTNNLTFRRRMELCQFESLDEIQKVFSVEALSKDFYKELSHWYFAAMGEIEFPNDINEPEAQLKANSLIRLITRLIFVWFMKQKQLVPDDLFDTEKLKNLINDKDSTGSTYYKAILQNLFFATLSTPKEAGRKFVNTQFGVQNFYRYKRFIKDETYFLEMMDTVPFLNGGLFESLDIIEPENDKIQRVDCFSDNPKNEHLLKVPDYLFFGKRTADISSFYEAGNYDKVQVEGIIDLLNRFDFTIDENTANDQEVALDPELLGLVFENLLASYNPETQSSARKESGSFYTPRPIVDYMAEESLVQYLKNETQLARVDLRLLFKTEQELPFTTNEKQAITEALSTLKVIDPACGSGAFPMGVLLKMVQVLNHIDPENNYWRNAQLDRLKAKTFEAFDKKEIQDIKAEIDSIFNNELNDPDYARKLYLIENCIYGVDIQPIAMQIAKLRFFISLLVEQRIDKSKENFGILALPNLETKFVAANTLIQPQKPRLDLFTNQTLLEKQEELKQCRHKLFSARTLKTKKKYRSLDKQLRDEMAELLKKPNTSSHQDAEQFAQWDPYKPDSKSPWFDPEWMFGVKGFDMVIGNPPYVQLQKAQPGNDKLKYADDYKNESYKTFERTGDIYALFYERGIQILEDKGILSYITSNKWMRAKYGASLRKYLARYNPLLLLDMGPGVFDAATVDVNILIAENSQPKTIALKALKLEDKNQINQLDDTQFVTLHQLGEDAWIILNPVEQAIKQKIERIGTPLKDWDVRINRGVLTGYNDAFIIDGAVKDQLIAEDPKSAEIIKPILRGRDIKRYHAKFADKWLIATHNGYKNDQGQRVPRIDIEEYPAVKAWLNEHWEKVEKRSDQGATPYNLRNCAYWEDFEKEKIVWKGISMTNDFCYDEINSFCNDKGNILTSYDERLSVKYLLGYLNTQLFYWQFSKVGITMGNGFEFKIQYINNIYIVEPKVMFRQKIENLVTTILTKKQNNEVTTAEEQQIDVLVYKLYELSYEEVLVVDPEFPLTQEAYDNYQIN